MMREQAIVAAYESAKDRLDGMTLLEFSEALAGADVSPVVVDGVCAGAVIVSGPEMHACVLPWACGRWMSKRFLTLMGRVMGEYGRIVTFATTDAGERFVKRLGFEREGAHWVKYGH